MTTTSPSTALVPATPVFTNTERLALAGFLAGYSGLTRAAYELDLRQYAGRCQQHHLRLFQARRADIERFARDLEARGRARATITRRLCTVAGSTATPSRKNSSIILPPRTSAGRGWTATSSAPCWSLPGSGRPRSMHYSRCWPSTGCGSPRLLVQTFRPWAWSAGTGPW